MSKSNEAKAGANPGTDPSSKPSIAAAGPLAGLRVIDWTHVLAGPFAGYQLGLLGAEVIRVERPDADDMIRAKAYDPKLAALGLGEAFVVQGAGKRSLALNARDPRAKQALAALIASADVLLENFRPGKLATLGFDPARLIAQHPKLVVCSITGFGPDSDRRAYDHVVQAASGFMAANANASGEPQRIGFPVIDYAVGLQAAQAVLAALLRRERQGRTRQQGEWLQVTMSGAALTLLGPVYAPQLVSGITPPRSTSTAFSGSALSGTFAVSDGHLALVCNAPDQAVGLRGALAEAGADEVVLTPLFAAADKGDVSAAQGLLTTLFAQGTVAQWEQRLAQHGVPATGVRSAAQAAAEVAESWPQVTLPLADGPRRVPVPGIGYGSTEPLTGEVGSPPLRGADTRALLGEAGLGADEIEAMFREGVAWEPGGGEA